MTLDIDLYKNRINVYKENSKDGKIEAIKKKISDNFTSIPSHDNVLIDDISKDIHIVDTADKVFNKKLVLCKPNETIERGNVVAWNDEIWLCVDLEKDKVQNKGIIEKCNYTIKHKNKHNNIIEIPSIISNKLDYSLGIAEGKPITIPDDKMKITISNNELANGITEGIRFVVDEKVYKITHMDRVTRKGLLDLTLEFSQKLPNDDIKNGIAYNEFANTPLPPLSPTDKLVIEGEDIIYYIDFYFEYITKLYNDEILTDPQPSITYSVDKPDLISTLQDGNVFKIKPIITNDKTTKQIIITVTDSVNIMTKTIRIQSLI